MSSSDYTQMSLFTQDDKVVDDVSPVSEMIVSVVNCIACGGTGKSSKGNQCIPCRINHQKSVLCSSS